MSLQRFPLTRVEDPTFPPPDIIVAHEICPYVDADRVACVKRDRSRPWKKSGAVNQFAVAWSIGEASRPAQKRIEPDAQPVTDSRSRHGPSNAAGHVGTIQRGIIEFRPNLGRDE